MTEEPNTPPPEDVEAAAVETQLEQVRTRLAREAHALGLTEPAVIDAVDRHAQRYRTAPVRNFVAVLVERAVRQELAIRATPTVTDRPG